MIKNYTEFILLLEAQQTLKLNVPKDVKMLHKLFKKNIYNYCKKKNKKLLKIMKNIQCVFL